MIESGVDKMLETSVIELIKDNETIFKRLRLYEKMLTVAEQSLREIKKFSTPPSSDKALDALTKIEFLRKESGQLF